MPTFVRSPAFDDPSPPPRKRAVAWVRWFAFAVMLPLTQFGCSDTSPVAVEHSESFDQTPTSSDAVAAALPEHIALRIEVEAELAALALLGTGLKAYLRWTEGSGRSVVDQDEARAWIRGQALTYQARAWDAEVLVARAEASHRKWLEEAGPYLEVLADCPESFLFSPGSDPLSSPEGLDILLDCEEEGCLLAKYGFIASYWSLWFGLIAIYACFATAGSTWVLCGIGVVGILFGAIGLIASYHGLGECKNHQDVQDKLQSVCGLLGDLGSFSDQFEGEASDLFSQVTDACAAAGGGGSGS